MAAVLAALHVPDHARTPRNRGKYARTRLPMVPVLSSAARMPLPGVAIALAVAISSSAYCGTGGQRSKQGMTLDVLAAAVGCYRPEWAASGGCRIHGMQSSSDDQESQAEGGRGRGVTLRCPSA